MDTINYTIRIPRELKDALKESAEKEGRSLNSHFIYILNKYLSQDKMEIPPDLDQKIEEAASLHRRSKGEEIMQRLINSFMAPEGSLESMANASIIKSISEAIAKGALAADANPEKPYRINVVVNIPPQTIEAAKKRLAKPQSDKSKDSPKKDDGRSEKKDQ